MKCLETLFGGENGNPLHYSSLSGGRHSMGSQRVRHDWAYTHTHTHTQTCLVVTTGGAGSGSHLQLAGEGQGDGSTSHKAQDGPTTQSYPAPNLYSAKAEKLLWEKEQAEHVLPSAHSYKSSSVQYGVRIWSLSQIRLLRKSPTQPFIILYLPHSRCPLSAIRVLKTDCTGACPLYANIMPSIFRSNFLIKPWKLWHFQMILHYQIDFLK